MLVVRVDPSDDASVGLLEGAADDLGDEPVPDIVLIERSDLNDQAVVRACDAVALHGQAAYALGGLARHEGVQAVDAAAVAEWVAMRPA